ncbi:MAG: D-alanine--D-alanine ligase family protein [Planctomycetota bacterium]
MTSNDRRLQVLVLMGGPDAEREVSLMSGREVATALRETNRYDVVEQVIDRPTARELAGMGGDVIFPVLHGQWGEGGGLQRELEAIDAVYVGSGPESSALAMNKLATKTLLCQHDVASPPARELRPDDRCDLDPPLVVKPVDDGSSVDLCVCRTREEVTRARAELHPHRPRLMVERFVAGRELTVGIALDEVLPLIEIVPADGLYDYAAKYEREDTGYTLDPPLPDGVAEECRRVAMVAFRRLGCRDIARADFILEGTTAWFLELNTMPGFTTHSLVPMAARHAGTPLPELCARLVQAAVRRQPQPV